MSQYYFHLRDAQGLLRDEEGRNLRDMAAVADTALLEARTLIGHEAFAGRINLHQSIEVEDAAGVIVHDLSFRDAVTFAGAAIKAPEATAHGEGAAHPVRATAQNDD